MNAKVSLMDFDTRHGGDDGDDSSYSIPNNCWLKSMINLRPRYLPKQINSFNNLNLRPELLLNIQTCLFQLKEIEKAIVWPMISSNPPIDLCIETSMSRVLSYAMAILQRLSLEESAAATSAPQSIVILPRRELALSIASVFHKLSENMDLKICTCVGGETTFSDMGKHTLGAHIIIGTPGRLSYLVGNSVLNYEKLKLVVFDYLDDSFEGGWGYELEDLVSIAKNQPNCQIVLTYKKKLPAIQQFCTHLRDPIQFVI